MHIRQIALAARKLDPAVAALTDLFDLDASYKDPGVGQFGLENVVMPVGDTFLEVVSPVRADTTAGRYLERRGDSGYMVIFETPSLAEDRLRVDALGARVVWEIALEDISTIHLHPKDTGGAILSLDQPKPAGAWRWGGPHWTSRIRTTRVRRIISAEIEARDPGGMAARWSSLLGSSEVVADGDSVLLSLDRGGELRFVPAGPRGEGISAIGVEIEPSAREAIVATARARGLHATADNVEVCGVRVDLV